MKTMVQVASLMKWTLELVLLNLRPPPGACISTLLRVTKTPRDADGILRR